MKFQIKINIPNSIIKIMCIVGLSLLSTLLIIIGIEFYEWLNSATCEDLTEVYHSGGSSIATHHSIDVKLVELECWK